MAKKAAKGKGKVGKALARHHRQMPEGSPGEEAGETPAMEAQEQAQGTEMPPVGMARGGRVKGGGSDTNPGGLKLHQTYARTGTPPGMAKGGKAKC